MKKTALLLASVILALTGCGGADGEEKNGLTIAVIPKGTTHEFWHSVHAGALKAAQEVGDIDIIWRAGMREEDREEQISLVQNFISQRVDAIALAPLDARALVQPVKRATQKNIPVVIFDSGLEADAGKDFVSYVATNNYLGGEMAGKHLAESLGGKGRVLLLRFVEGSESTTQREQGFLDALKKFPDIEVIDPKRYAGASRASAQEAAENLLSVYEDIQGAFAPAESTVQGFLLALRSRGLSKKVKLMGFDPSESLVQAMAEGEIIGIVLQNPIRMGYLAVQTALAHINGEPVEEFIDTGVMLATPENMNDTEVKEWLYPDYSKYLDAK